MRRLLLAVALLACGCGRRDAGAPGSVDYRAPDGSFRARLPGNWRADETAGETRRTALYGPPDGPQPFAQLIGVYFHAAADPVTAARAYLASTASGPAVPPREIAVGSRRGFESVETRLLPGVELKPQSVEVRTVAVPAPGGFFTLEHTRPAGSAAAPAFDELIRTFEPTKP